MPMSESCSQSKDYKVGIEDSEANKEFNRNFNQSLLGLKVLSSQTGQDIGFGDFLKRMEKKDDDIVLLDDTPSFKTQAPNLLQKNGTDMEFLSKSNKFMINDSIRNSFKDIISNAKITKPQEENSENENSLGNLLSKTKSIGLESKDKPLENTKNDHLQNGLTEKASGKNLFEKLQAIHCPADSQENNKDTQNKTDKETPHVIELDDSLEDELLKSNESSGLESKGSTEEHKEIDKKEEDKLLQIDSELTDSLDGNTVQDDLKTENKLLEIDNENSNNSVISVKSNHSVKSNSSVKSSVSVHSVKSDNHSNHSVQSSKSLIHDKSDAISNHNNSSNHSVKSDIGENSAKSFSSVKSGTSSNSKAGNQASESNHNDRKSNGHISDTEQMSVDNDCDRNVEKEADSSSGSKDNSNQSEGSNKKSPKAIELQDENTTESISKSLDNNSEASQDAKSLSKSSSGDKLEKMEVDSDDDKEREASTPNSSTGKSDYCSNTAEDCDSDTNMSKPEISEKLQEGSVKTDNKSADSDRKRPADTEDSLSSLPKRSRLDDVIGKLGTQIGIPLDRVKGIEDLSDTDATDASHLDSEVNTESKSEETSTDTDVEDDDEDEDVAKMESPVKSPKKSRRVSQKELGMIVKAKVMLYLRTYRDETLKDLHRKIDDLQRTNDHWKNKAKDLERRMLELTVLQQKHEKRKAKTAALRQISSKSIGVQVDENKVEKSKEIAQQQQTQNQTTPNKSGNKTPPRSFVAVTIQSPPIGTALNQAVPSVATLPRTSFAVTTTQSQIQQALNLPVQRAPSHVLLSPPTQIQKSVTVTQMDQLYPNSKTVKSLLDTSRQQQKFTPGITSTAGINSNATVVFPPSKVGQLPQQQFIMVSSAPPSISTATKPNIPGKPLSKIIDLTDEEENAAKLGIPQVTKMAPIPAVVSNIQQNLIRNLTPQQTPLPQQSILLSGPAGTRFINPAQPQYQLVINSGAQNLRPGSLVTVVSAAGAPGLQGLRPPIISQQPAVPPPQLQAAQLVPLASFPRSSVAATSMATGFPQSRLVRPPPPLQSAPNSQNNQIRQQAPPVTQTVPQPVTPKPTHPAPLPKQDPPVIKPGEKPLVPKPTLKISRVSQGIVLSWNMSYIAKNHAEIQSYQLYAYQETAAPPTATLWKKVGDVKALPLPMACTLTQFQEGNRYHFAVRPIDIHSRAGPFSDPSSIHLMAMK